MAASTVPSHFMHFRVSTLKYYRLEALQVRHELIAA